MSTYPVKRPNSVAFVLTTREPLCRRCNEIIRRKHFQIYTASDIATSIEGFHRVTFTSNFDVNVEIGGHFGDQGAIEATV